MRSFLTPLFALAFSIAVNAQTKFVEQHAFKNDVFIANNGQFFSWINPAENVHFVVSNGAEMFQFTPAGVNIRTTTIKERFEKKTNPEKTEGEKTEESHGRRPIVHESFTAMRWIGADPQAKPEPSEKQSSYVTYVLKTVSGEFVGVQSDIFKKITYRNVYPGIDIEYIIPEKGGIKYNVIVHPGADPS
ncbi:MAG: hypothetical protein ACRC3B_03245, partial [Bacteroidia bacterium]